MRYGKVKFALGDKTSKQKSQNSIIAITLSNNYLDRLVLECLDNKFFN